MKVSKTKNINSTAGFAGTVLGFFKTIVLLFTIPLLSGLGCDAQTKKQKKENVQFKKHIITNDFIAEGATVGDVNKDGKLDILAGAFWFEAPDWKRHEIATPIAFSYKDGYSNSFLDFASDVNQDGWIDLVRIDIPGAPAAWYENNKNQPGHWKEHALYSSVGNESPVLIDVDGDGQADLLCNDPERREVIWLQSPVTPGDTLWKRFVISKDSLLATHKYTHGLGFGDMNGDGKKDVIVKMGWWESPADPKQPDWVFHKANLGEDCAEMYLYDVDGDGDMDLVSSSAHDYGIWWHEKILEKDGSVSWKEHLINKTFSESHGLAMEDINGDGYPDLITGKRYFAHNGGDPGGLEAAVLYWFEFKPGKTPGWTPHLIDDNSGVGLHVVIKDMNNDGLPDIVTGNKKGVFYFEQVK
ncbi:MAG: VCBS repeat-containing protein [Bacteroidota bacterium]